MENEFLSIRIEYKFSSCISSDMDTYDCIKEYTAILFMGEYEDNSLNEYIGEIKFKIINLNKAESENIDMYEVFDTYEYIFRHSQNFYDFKKGTLKKNILNKFPDLEFVCHNICIIETIGIIPKLRGKRIGPKVFKNLVWNFDDVQFFVLQPYPLQFENSGNEKSFLSKLDLDKFEKNKKKATDSLTKYYNSWGLQKIKGIKDLLFYSSMYRNEIFDDIDMDLN